ncbi:MAG TPA: transposase [Planctomycetaceae bacterium]|nr:transposase [Planctomycetaceae bacterium]
MRDADFTLHGPVVRRQEYDQQPATIEIRLVDFNVKRTGFRPDRFTVATTILDDKQVSGDWIRSVYESRWLVELDIRAIKCSLNMDVLRAKTPGMVRTELWSCLLAYNLIRLKMLGITASSSQRVGHRDGRVEPRVNKRRPNVLALMQKQRPQLRRELKAAA